MCEENENVTGARQTTYRTIIHQLGSTWLSSIAKSYLGILQTWNQILEHGHELDHRLWASAGPLQHSCGWKGSNPCRLQQLVERVKPEHRVSTYFCPCIFILYDVSGVCFFPSFHTQTDITINLNVLVLWQCKHEGKLPRGRSLKRRLASRLVCG